MEKPETIPIITHEIKNLLAGITGAVRVLFADIAPDDPRKAIIKEILSQTERLDEAIKKLLSFIGPVEGTKDA